VSSALVLCRLVLATAVVLAPGVVVARAIGVRGASAAVAWGLTLVLGALGITFAVSASLTLTLGLLLAAGLVALPFARRAKARVGDVVSGVGWAWAAGAVLGLLLWQVASRVSGDGLFHLARVRKLLELDELGLKAVAEFADGGLHPGYAIPLWHGLVALVAKVSMLDPAEVAEHLPTVLAPLAVVVAYEAGWALFRRGWAAGATAGAAVAIAAVAPGHGGAYVTLALPATAARQLLVPALIALLLAAVRKPTAARLASVAAAALVVSVVHVSYLPFTLIPFVGFLLVRWAWTRDDVRSGALSLAATGVPFALYLAWLLPVVRDTASVSPDEGERSRAVAQYASQLDVDSPERFHLLPEVLTRTGAVAVAALLLVPLAGLASRRRWAAYVVGGTLPVLVVVLLPWLFVPFSDVVSLSQARRFAGFLPFAFAFAGGLGVLARLLGPLVVPGALGGGIVLQLAYPGSFGLTLSGDTPAWPTWVALAGGMVALAIGFLQRPTREAAAGLAAAAFLLPVAAHGVVHWSPLDRPQASVLSEGLVDALRSEVPVGAIVFSDPRSSYAVAAEAPVYVCNALVTHVADTAANRPYGRREEAKRFLATGDLTIPRACGAQWVLVDVAATDLELDLPIVYRDGRYVLYRL
jgi:hypothetical protein